MSPEGEIDFKFLAADNALYRARHEGRNHVAAALFLASMASMAS